MRTFDTTWVGYEVKRTPDRNRLIVKEKNKKSLSECKVTGDALRDFSNATATWR